MDDFLEELEEKKAKRGWVILLWASLAFFAYLPMSWVLGEAEFFAGSLLKIKGATETLLLSIPLYLLSVYVLLAAHFARSKFVVPGQKPARLAIAFLLWGLPLASFSYWMGDFTGALYAHTTMIALAGALAVPLLIFWRTGSLGPLAIGIGVLSAVSVFVVEDILSPFSPLFVYAAQTARLQTLRTLSLVGAVLIATLYPVPVMGRVKERAQTMRATLIALAALSFGLFVWESVGGSARLIAPETSWVCLVALALFFDRRDRFSQTAFTLIASVQGLLSLLQFVVDVMLPDGSASGQLHLLLEAWTTVWISRELKRRWVQRRLRQVSGRPLSDKLEEHPASV